MGIKNVTLILDSVVEGIGGTSSVESVDVRNVKTGEKRSIPVSGVFAAVGMVPQTQLLGGILTLAEGGYIPAGEDCRTQLRGVYAAGDIRTKALRQIVTAVADGANAVNSALELF
jgi:thioredoxin reductase (NADPH)